MRKGFLNISSRQVQSAHYQSPAINPNQMVTTLRGRHVVGYLCVKKILIGMEARNFRPEPRNGKLYNKRKGAHNSLCSSDSLLPNSRRIISVPDSQSKPTSPVKRSRNYRRVAAEFAPKGNTGVNMRGNPRDGGCAEVAATVVSSSSSRRLGFESHYRCWDFSFHLQVQHSEAAQWETRLICLE
jgi:hypothetical protein